MTDEHLQSRLLAIEKEKAQRLKSRKEYDDKKAALEAEIEQMRLNELLAVNEHEAVLAEVNRCNDGLEKGKNELIALLQERGSIQSRKQRFATMLEQINIRKAELTKRLLDRKTREAGLDDILDDANKKLNAVNEEIAGLKEKESALLAKAKEWRDKSGENVRLMEEASTEYHKSVSRLESLKNIAERYDGYGNSIKRVMEQKAKNPGLLGVVSDLIQVDIQNIVTEDEATAKKMIGFLKANHFGRATFLPLTSVRANRNTKNEAALGEKGVLGIANKLVKCDTKFDEVVAYLLGRVIVVDTIDNAIALAKKNHYSLHIVTVEGEYLAPGGSMSGGAFKNSSNLLARNREIEELEKRVDQTKTKLKELRARKDDIATAIALGEEDIAATKTLLQEKYIEQNTAQISVDRADQQKKESANVYEDLSTENAEIEKQLEEMNQGKKDIAEQLEASKQREEQLEKENSSYSEILEKQGVLEQEASHKAAAISLELANITKTAEFAITKSI